jgi:hypothetical protein
MLEKGKPCDLGPERRGVAFCEAESAWMDVRPALYGPGLYYMMCDDVIGDHHGTLGGKGYLPKTREED